MVWFLLLSLEQKSGFKHERNKDLTFIVIIIDIDWYENNYCDNFLGHIAQPYSEVRAKLVPPNGTYPTRQDTRLGSWEWDEIRFLDLKKQIPLWNIGKNSILFNRKTQKAKN